MLFDLEEAIMFTPKPQEYTDPVTGETKKKQIKFFPDVYKDRIGKSYNDYISGHQMNLFEDFIGYQGSAVLDEPEQKTDTISVPIPQCEESENGQIYAEKFTSVSLICGPFYFVILIRMDVKFQG